MVSINIKNGYYDCRRTELKKPSNLGLLGTNFPSKNLMRSTFKNLLLHHEGCLRSPFFYKEKKKKKGLDLASFIALVDAISTEIK